MKFATGDIIKSTIRSTKSVFHTGIILIKNEEVWIAHNTPMKRNRTGGNVIVETLEDFLAAGRTIVRRQPTSLSYEHIMSSVEAVNNIPFHLVNFNCEHFITFVRTGKKPKSLIHKVDKFINNVIRKLPRKSTAKRNRKNDIKKNLVKKVL